MEKAKVSNMSLADFLNSPDINIEEIDKFTEGLNDMSPSSRITAFLAVLNFMLNNDNKLCPKLLHISEVLAKKHANDFVICLKSENVSELLQQAELCRLSKILIWLEKCIHSAVGSTGEKIPLGNIAIILLDKLEEYKKHSNILSQIASILLLCPASIPNGQKAFKMSNTIIYMVADFPIPTTPQTHKHMVIIGELLDALWRKLSLDDLKLTLLILYQIVSNPDSSVEVCPAMAHILSLVSESVVTKLAPRLVSSPQHGSWLPFTATLTRLSNWLVSWPYANDTLNFWIRILVQLLCQSGKFTLPKKTAVEQISKLIEALRIPVCRQGACNGITTFLMSYQFSADLFIQVIPQLVKMVLILKREDTMEVKEILTRVHHLCLAQFIIHPIEHDSYQMLRDQLKSLAIPMSEDITDLISGYRWAANTAPSIELNSIALEPIELKSRGISQKIGLGNLGNTCYMNSVIQALFMTDSFRTSVIQSRIKPNQPLLTALRRLFALLCFSNRSFISPNLFHNTSRPHWFQSGMQHDCSEYLRHLLTALYEEDNVTNILSDFTEPMNTNNSETASLASDLQLLPEDPEFDNIDKMFVAENDVYGTYVMNDWSKSEKQSNLRVADCNMNFDSELSRNVALSASTVDSQASTKCEDLSEVADYVMDLDNSTDSINSCKRKKSAPDVAGSPIGRALKGDLLCTETDSASDSGISGDLTEEKDFLGLTQTAADSNTILRTDLQRSGTDFVTLVRKVFGGMMSTTIKCLNCQTKSVHEDVFTDINLAFQDADHGAGSPPSRRGQSGDNAKSDLTIEQMLCNYLHTETLSGDNQYACERCHSKQDAEKSIRIIEAPDHLILTQLRFYYDVARGQRQKVFTKVNFKEDLLLPLYQSESYAPDSAYHAATTTMKPNGLNDETAGKDYPRDEQQMEAYTLYAVVVHSGVSSEGGHYYCFARSSSLASVHPRDRERCGELGDWYNFNDEDVTRTNFDNISRLASTFTRDTAYLLFYQKVGDLKYSNAANTIEDRNNLQYDIKDVIESDNRMFQSELESMQRKQKTNSFKKSPRQDPPPPPPPGNCGGGGLDFSPPEIF